jgi:hypothetical protein
MTDNTAKTGPAEPAPDDDDIAEAAARLSAKWASERQTNGSARGAGNGQILQTLEKGRSNMVAVEVKRSRRSAR